MRRRSPFHHRPGVSSMLAHHALAVARPPRWRSMPYCLRVCRSFRSLAMSWSSRMTIRGCSTAASGPYSARRRTLYRTGARYAGLIVSARRSVWWTLSMVRRQPAALLTASALLLAPSNGWTDDVVHCHGRRRRPRARIGRPFRGPRQGELDGLDIPPARSGQSALRHVHQRLGRRPLRL